MFAAIFRREHLFPLIIGPIDGILTALTLAAGRIVSADDAIDMSLVVRISLAAALSGGFVFFVAEYGRLRGELVHAARHLNIASADQLVASQLGRTIVRDAVHGTIIASTGGFLGAMFPLTIGAMLSGYRWMTIGIAAGTLALLGVAISRAIQGNGFYWSVGLSVTGLLLSGAGIVLHVA